MLIIAGALLLVCGGLMLGGGFMLRAKTPGSSPVTAATAAEPIAWLFEHPSLPIDERAVFVVDATPDGLRIKGFAIGGVNLSEVAAWLARRRRSSRMDTTTISSSSSASSSRSKIPTQRTLRRPRPSLLRFCRTGRFRRRRRSSWCFSSRTGGGMTPQEVVAAYGGLLLKVHYEMDGKQRSLIQYLPTSLLEEQFAEIQAAAKGS